MSAVELLREAAKTMRDRVAAMKAACHTDWGDRAWAVDACNETGCPCIVHQGEPTPWDEPQVPAIQYVADGETPEHAQHIASWHPAVALAVADWLDYAADVVEHLQRGGHDPAPNGYTSRALAVARAYLNRGQS